MASTQQAFLQQHGVPADRIVIGHSGDTEDLGYLRELMDNGSTIGMDRFGMEHVLPDDRRVATVLRLLEPGTPSRWSCRMMRRSTATSRRRHGVPARPRIGGWGAWWNRILPMLRAGGASEADLEQMLVTNPRRLLEPSP